MQYNVTNLKRRGIILNNIRLLRNFRGIKSETMSKEIGISKSEYSKLENGHKMNWEKYWDKIAACLGVESFDLVFEDCLIQTQKREFENRAGIQNFNKNLTINQRVQAILDERDQLKNKQIENYKEEIVYWRKKYNRLKIRLEKMELEKNKYIKKSNILPGTFYRNTGA